MSEPAGWVLVAALLLVSCGPEPTQEQRAIQVAYKHAQKQWEGDSDKFWLPPETVEDHGHYWLIKFGSEPGATGGGPWVEVRKSDLKVLGIVGFQ